MIKRHSVSILLAVVTLIGTAAQAEVPRLINYQGVLTSGGSPVTNPVDVNFAIYNDFTEGTALWSEMQSVTPNADGVFGVLLGSTNPIPDSALSGGLAFLGITIGADPEITPRSQLVSSGYSFRVGTLDGATGGTVTDPIILVDTLGDTTEIGPLQIVVRGSGGDEASTYYGDNGVVISSAGNPNVGLSPDGIFIYGATEADTTIRIGPGGLIHVATGGIMFSDSTIQFTQSGASNGLPLGGGTMEGPIASVGEPYIRMGAANFGSGNSSDSANYAFVAGESNSADGDHATISGGMNNSATGAYAVVAGGGSAAKAGSNEASGTASTVGGGEGNVASGEYSTVCGGLNDSAAADYTCVVGGELNSATWDHAFVGGGSGNEAGASHSFVGGGKDNSSPGAYGVVAGGQNNQAVYNYTAVLGGTNNIAELLYASVGGGHYNKARGLYSVVAGGGGTTEADSNLALGEISTVSGGRRNMSLGLGTTIGGGVENYADTLYGVVSGGFHNAALRDFCTVGGGRYDSADGAYATVGGGHTNVTTGNYATIAGGEHGTVTGHRGAIGGGGYNTSSADYSTVSGGTTNTADGNASVVSGGSHNSASDIYTTVGGGRYDTADGDYATVGGGYINVTSNTYATIAGGRENIASGSRSFIGGGYTNDATALDAVVGGGEGNIASHEQATVGGGSVNVASGIQSTVPGGRDNLAAGTYSFAAGRLAKADHYGSYVWADGKPFAVHSSDSNQYIIYASGGVGINHTSPSAPLQVDGGEDIEPGSGGYAVFGETSSTNVAIDDNEIMARDNGSAARLTINNEGGDVIIGNLSSDDVGIGTNSPSAKLHVDGDICYTGSIGACSDARYKKDVKRISSALETILQLRGITYHWKVDEYLDHEFDDEEHVGFIAQEVAEYLPSVVMTDKKGYLSVDYSRLTPVLVEAVRDLRAENEAIKAEVARLTDLVEALLAERRTIGSPDLSQTN